jgi:hypothetical protein
MNTKDSPINNQKTANLQIILMDCWLFHVSLNYFSSEAKLEKKTLP